MCGIAGIITLETDESLAHRLDLMVKAQAHRGPDGEGRWLGEVGRMGVAVGHSRLAIIDLSEGGAQPYVSRDGRYVLTYNGEIYNYRELREELVREGVEFQTESDTEVLFHALIRWDEGALPKLNGMWAFALLDSKRGTMLLSRDRFGIKPLYLYRGKRGLLFASEIKALLAGTRERFQPNLKVVARYLNQALLDAQSDTFFTGIEALPPGHFLKVNLAAGYPFKFVPRRYWSLPEQDSFTGTEDERIETVRETFVDAVRLRLRSDVAVGVLLSGGVDSSSIAAAMHRILGSRADLRLLSAVSDDPRFDEQPFINRMGAHLGCQVTKVPLRFGPQECFDLLGQVVYANDEPVGSLSNVAHYLLMREAKRFGVTVVLSGQGADEILCGYRKFLGFYLESLVRTGHPLKATGVFLGFLRQRTTLSQLSLSEAKRYLPAMRRLSGPDIRGSALRECEFALNVGLNGENLITRQARDVESFSVPALLHYEDRMSMAWSREIRVPFLDYRLVNMLLPLEPAWKLRQGWTKWIFRKAMEPYLPPEVAWRKDKQGFVNPQSEWFKRELRDEVRNFLAGEWLTARAGLIDQAAMRARYERYCRQPAVSGVLGFKDIFNPICLEIWARRFADHISH